MFKIIRVSHRLKQVRGGAGCVAPAINVVKKVGLSLVLIGLILAQVSFPGLAMANPRPGGSVAAAAASLQPAQSALPQAQPGPPSGILPLSSSQSYTGFLTAPAAGDPLDIALDYIRQNRKELGLTEADLADIVVKDRYTSPEMGVTHLYLRQRLNGIEVFNGDININITSAGQVLNLGNRFVSDLQGSVNTTTPTISAADAVGRAAQHLNLTLTTPLVPQRNIGGPDREVIFNDGGISQDDIPVKLMYQPGVKETRLVWNLILNLRSDDNWWNVRVDAETGQVLEQNDWIAHDTWAPVGAVQPPTITSPAEAGSAQPELILPQLVVNDGSSYQVYPMPVESPNHTSSVPPADGRTIVNTPADATASPFGWHDTNGASGAEFTTTQGNNVHAYTDVNDDNAVDLNSSPNGGAGLDFAFPITLSQPPSTYRPAVVTNLFYWNNIIHDVFYRYGFNEAAGNFQQNNYGRGGQGKDYLLAEAQDGADVGKRNNANFGTPPDGGNPRMQMFVWNTTNPEVDGDLDAGIIVHEYGHGVSTRLTGGPSNANCLFNSEQMGEGWSDWLALALTARPGDSGPVGRGVGTYAFGQPTTGVGIRTFPYSIDMNVNPQTYNSIKGMTDEHDVGAVWAAMLWEVYWKLVESEGFNTNFYGASTSGGNNLAMQLVLDGMKLQPCSPGFVDGRNAILAADQALTGGVNQCLLWEAFAKRGLGYSASQGSSDNVEDGSQAFDRPPSCQFLRVIPNSINICRGQPAVFTTSIGPSYTPPVNLSVSGKPAGTTASFNPNPVNSAPGSSILTIGNTGSVAGGVYNMTIQGTSAATSTSAAAQLTVAAGTPGPTTLLTPANGAINQSSQPLLSWSAVAQVTSYRLELSNNAGFAPIVYSAVVSGASHTPSVNLQSNTIYYWRVIPLNSCGSGPASGIFSFATVAIACSTPNVSIPDGDPTGIASTITLTNTTPATGLKVYLDVSHTWLGDLSFTLTHVETGRSVTIIDRPGYPGQEFGCAGDDIAATFSDEAAKPAESSCTSASGLADGPYRPNSPLSVFNGETLSGNWRLTAVDSTSPDAGQLNSWCLSPVGAPPAIPSAYTNYLPLILK